MKLAAALRMGRYLAYAVTLLLFGVSPDSVNTPALVLWFAGVLIVELGATALSNAHELNALRTQQKQLEAAYDELVHKQLQLQGEAVLEERSRMARELHDTVSRSLTAIIVTTESLQRRLNQPLEHIDKELTTIKEQARLGLKDTRHSLSHLRPSLTPNELQGSLKALASQIERWYDVRVSLKLEGDFSRMGPEHEPVLFRLIQEAATNAIRHGRCTEISVRITDGPQCFTVEVQDNGAGCQVVNLGYGLTGMTERINAVGGAVAFYSQPGQGFTVTATFPVQEVGYAKD